MISNFSLTDIGSAFVLPSLSPPIEGQFFSDSKKALLIDSNGQVIVQNWNRPFTIDKERLSILIKDIFDQTYHLEIELNSHLIDRLKKNFNDSEWPSSFPEKLAFKLELRPFLQHFPLKKYFVGGIVKRTVKSDTQAYLGNQSASHDCIELNKDLDIRIDCSHLTHDELLKLRDETAIDYLLAVFFKQFPSYHSYIDFYRTLFRLAFSEQPCFGEEIFGALKLGNKETWIDLVFFKKFKRDHLFSTDGFAFEIDAQTQNIQLKHFSQDFQEQCQSVADIACGFFHIPKPEEVNEKGFMLALIKQCKGAYCPDIAAWQTLYHTTCQFLKTSKYYSQLVEGQRLLKYFQFIAKAHLPTELLDARGLAFQLLLILDRIGKLTSVLQEEILDGIELSDTSNAIALNEKILNLALQCVKHEKISFSTVWSLLQLFGWFCQLGMNREDNWVHLTPQHALLRVCLHHFRFQWKLDWENVFAHFRQDPAHLSNPSIQALIAFVFPQHPIRIEQKSSNLESELQQVALGLKELDTLFRKDHLLFVVACFLPQVQKKEILELAHSLINLKNDSAIQSWIFSQLKLADKKWGSSFIQALENPPHQLEHKSLRYCEWWILPLTDETDDFRFFSTFWLSLSKEEQQKIFLDVYKLVAKRNYLQALSFFGSYFEGASLKLEAFNQVLTSFWQYYKRFIPTQKIGGLNALEYILTKQFSYFTAPLKSNDKDVKAFLGHVLTVIQEMKGIFSPSFAQSFLLIFKQHFEKRLFNYFNAQNADVLIVLCQTLQSYSIDSLKQWLLSFESKLKSINVSKLQLEKAKLLKVISEIRKTPLTIEQKLEALQNPHYTLEKKIELFVYLVDNSLKEISIEKCLRILQLLLNNSTNWNQNQQTLLSASLSHYFKYVLSQPLTKEEFYKLVPLFYRVHTELKINFDSCLYQKWLKAAVGANKIEIFHVSTQLEILKIIYQQLIYPDQPFNRAILSEFQDCFSQLIAQPCLKIKDYIAWIRPLLSVLEKQQILELYPEQIELLRQFFAQLKKDDKFIFPRDELLRYLDIVLMNPLYTLVEYQFIFDHMYRYLNRENIYVAFHVYLIEQGLILLCTLSPEQDILLRDNLIKYLNTHHCSAMQEPFALIYYCQFLSRLSLSSNEALKQPLKALFESQIKSLALANFNKLSPENINHLHPYLSLLLSLFCQSPSVEFARISIKLILHFKAYQLVQATTHLFTMAILLNDDAVKHDCFLLFVYASDQGDDFFKLDNFSFLLQTVLMFIRETNFPRKQAFLVPAPAIYQFLTQMQHMQLQTDLFKTILHIALKRDPVSKDFCQLFYECKHALEPFILSTPERLLLLEDVYHYLQACCYSKEGLSSHISQYLVLAQQKQFFKEPLHFPLIKNYLEKGVKLSLYSKDLTSVIQLFDAIVQARLNLSLSFVHSLIRLDSQELHNKVLHYWLEQLQRHPPCYETFSRNKNLKLYQILKDIYQLIIEDKLDSSWIVSLTTKLPTKASLAIFEIKFNFIQILGDHTYQQALYQEFLNQLPVLKRFYPHEISDCIGLLIQSWFKSNQSQNNQELQILASIMQLHKQLLHSSNSDSGLILSQKIESSFITFRGLVDELLTFNQQATKESIDFKLSEENLRSLPLKEVIKLQKDGLKILLEQLICTEAFTFKQTVLLIFLQHLYLKALIEVSDYSIELVSLLHRYTHNSLLFKLESEYGFALYPFHIYCATNLIHFYLERITNKSSAHLSCLIYTDYTENFTVQQLFTAFDILEKNFVDNFSDYHPLKNWEGLKILSKLLNHFKGTETWNRYNIFQLFKNLFNQLKWLRLHRIPCEGIEILSIETATELELIEVTEGGEEKEQQLPILEILGMIVISIDHPQKPLLCIEYLHLLDYIAENYRECNLKSFHQVSKYLLHFLGLIIHKSKVCLFDSNSLQQLKENRQFYEKIKTFPIKESAEKERMQSIEKFYQ